MDLAEGHVKAVDHILGKGKEGVHIFNLGTGTGATVLEVIAAFSEASGKKIPHVIAPRRKGDVDSLYASCQVAESVLGWKSRRSLGEMCRDMWNRKTMTSKKSERKAQRSCMTAYNRCRSINVLTFK